MAEAGMVVTKANGQTSIWAPFEKGVVAVTAKRAARLVITDGARRAYVDQPVRAGQRVRFEARGESYLPTALASMASKYLRELAMRAVNAFWRRHVEGLRPTAGYPEDTRRFKADIAAAQRRLGIPDRLLWRCK